MRILLVEDNLELADIVKKELKASGFEVDHQETFSEGQFNAEVNHYDVLLIDVVLPDGNGLDLVKNLRDNGNQTPILILTVQSKVSNIVKGLNIGADDYLPKPFHAEELVARVRALSRRGQKKGAFLETNGLSLDPLTFEATYKGKKIDLVRKEFALLEYLIKKKGYVLTRPQLFEHVWGMDDYPLNNTIDVHISMIRNKLNKVSKRNIIKTIRGIGYKIEDN